MNSDNENNLIHQKHCIPCEGGVSPISLAEVKVSLKKIPGWSLSKDKKEILRKFEFENYYQTIAFVNAIAWMAHRENHHPDLEVGFNHCSVCYSTHAISGLSENDFICASKVNQILSFS